VTSFYKKLMTLLDDKNTDHTNFIKQNKCLNAHFEPMIETKEEKEEKAKTQLTESYAKLPNKSGSLVNTWLRKQLSSSRALLVFDALFETTLLSQIFPSYFDLLKEHRSWFDEIMKKVDNYQWMNNFEKFSSQVCEPTHLDYVYAHLLACEISGDTGKLFVAISKSDLLKDRFLTADGKINPAFNPLFDEAILNHQLAFPSATPLAQSGVEAPVIYQPTLFMMPRQQFQQPFFARPPLVELQRHASAPPTYHQFK
jgi:hypothetical protein